jgi:hypothetical protein
MILFFQQPVNDIDFLYSLADGIPTEVPLRIPASTAQIPAAPHSNICIPLLSSKQKHTIFLSQHYFS